MGTVTSNNKLIFYGTTGIKMPSNQIGGGERGCLRTMALYNKLDVSILPVEKPSRTIGVMSFAIDSVKTLFLFFVTLIRNPQVPVHIVGFYEHQLYYESILFGLSKLFGHSVVYELRNGTLVKTFDYHSALYQWVIRKMVRKANLVLCQGLEFVRFIKEKWGVDTVYYPNYILDKDIKPYQERQHNPLRLIYFGRITENKNVDVVIKVVGLLMTYHADVVLDIIGAYSDSYKSFLDTVIKEMNIPTDVIVFHGAQPFNFITEKLSRAHYFIFPSEEPKEGHSNSLTEAMAFGVVPIVSDAGFNATICGNPDLVIKEISAELFASKIIQIEKTGTWSEHSLAVYKRFCENYTELKALETIKTVCDELLLNTC